MLSAQVLAENAAQYGSRHGKENCQRNGPAFIQSCQAEEYEDKGNYKNLHGAVACFNLVTALVSPFIAVSYRQSFCRNFFQSSHSLAGRITFGRVACNFNSACAVKARHNNGAVLIVISYKSVQRNHRAIVAAYKEITHIVNVGAVFVISLHNNFPCTAEVVQVIDFVTAEEGLQCAEYAGNRYVQALCLITVYIEFIHRRGGVQGGVNHAYFRALACFRQKFLRTVIHQAYIFTAKVHNIHA